MVGELVLEHFSAVVFDDGQLGGLDTFWSSQ
jgi:hypothetical protein